VKVVRIVGPVLLFSGASLSRVVRRRGTTSIPRSGTAINRSCLRGL